ncbi:MAG: hypothetical protein MZV70_33520 [Desulfobacterales bacterium]|nr:hypothetical protein [Desulfobacterales bacterium]
MERDARLFKVLSDLTRLKLMVILTVSGETCVCRLTESPWRFREPGVKTSCRSSGERTRKGETPGHLDALQSSHPTFRSNKTPVPLLRHHFVDQFRDDAGL